MAFIIFKTMNNVIE